MTKILISITKEDISEREAEILIAMLRDLADTQAAHFSARYLKDFSSTNKISEENQIADRVP